VRGPEEARGEPEEKEKAEALTTSAFRKPYYYPPYVQILLCWSGLMSEGKN
jgi:hypothetical protein